MHKRTNIELDTDLVKEAMKLTDSSTIKEVIHRSLEELVRVTKRKRMLKFKGKVVWEGDLDQMRSL